MNQSLGFYIGNFFVAYYGLMIVLGLIMASVIGWYLTKRHQKDFNDFILIAAVGGLGGMIGAKLLYLIVSFDQIDFSRLTDIQYLNAIFSGGFVYYGGLIGGLAGLFICRKFLHIDVVSYLKFGILCVPIVHGFGRIGCSLVGCCYGVPYIGPGAVTYTSSLFAPLNTPLFPVQLVEAVLNLVLALMLFLLDKRLTGTAGIKLYLFSYAVIRFVLEFFRYDDVERGKFLGLSTSSYISILIAIAVFVFHMIEKKRTVSGKWELRNKV